ncbi:hypothetical protein QFC21_003101 [Naganishia friedmannii]|uniref:Uncharacterized protein n=1 Tax=Naganishia friedmannii TaxID=89922 RepID=A0ACC2VTJ7_9TREE|nr:hypothetical protein QFC21_003101 [Naganishia friedmannii]
MKTSRIPAGYNDPPPEILRKGSSAAHTTEGMNNEPDLWGYDVEVESSAGSPEATDKHELGASDGKKPPKQPRNRRLTNALTSSAHLARTVPTSSMNDHRSNGDMVGTTRIAARSKAKYPVHPSVPVGSADGPSSLVTEEDQLSASYKHQSPQWDGIHALEHEIEDTLFRGSEVDHRNHLLLRERSQSRESKQYCQEDISMEMDATIDEDTLKKMRRSRYLRSAAVTGIFVMLWYLFATLLSLYNKWMFSPEYYGFSYPLFVTCIHMVVQFTLATIVRQVWSDRFKPKETPGREDYIKGIIPTAVATGMDIGLSNLSLKTISLTLYTMCKSSSLIFVLGFAFLFKLEAYSLRLVFVIGFITFGVFLMVFNATTVSIPGIVMVFSASALGGLRWALTQLVMHKTEMGMSNPFATIFWLTPVMAVTLAFVSIVFEGWFNVFGSDHFSGWKALHTTGLIIFPGALAFSMVASEYCIIQRAGIVPLSIAGIFKEVSTITVSAWVFGDELTKLNVLGVVITIFGIATYSYHKYQKTMELPSNLPTAQHSLLPTTTGVRVGPYREECRNEDDAGDQPNLSNNSDANTGHHVIGDSDDEHEYSDTERKQDGQQSCLSSEEHRGLLGRNV